MPLARALGLEEIRVLYCGVVAQRAYYNRPPSKLYTTPKETYSTHMIPRRTSYAPGFLRAPIGGNVHGGPAVQSALMGAQPGTDISAVLHRCQWVQAGRDECCSRNHAPVILGRAVSAGIGPAGCLRIVVAERPLHHIGFALLI